jgi:SAM-dependent methyltransferase
MNIFDAAGLLFAGMEKLGPGDDKHTVHILRLLPVCQDSIVVDAGCGTGRQTFALAGELDTRIHAVDSYEPFLVQLQHRAEKAGIRPRIETHCMDMKDIPRVFPHIDLLWSEGAAYTIGFANALTIWATAIRRGGFAAVTELSWLREQVPGAAKEFFLNCYPDMRSVSQNILVAETAGYKVLTTDTLPREAWIDGYYEVLEPRAKALLNHPDPVVKDFAAESLREIEIFKHSDDSYGYVFYALERV